MHADDLERLPADADGLADRRDAAEQLALHLAADERDAPLQPHVLGVEEAAAGLRRLAAHRRRSARRTPRTR